MHTIVARTARVALRQAREYLAHHLPTVVEAGTLATTYRIEPAPTSDGGVLIGVYRVSRLDAAGRPVRWRRLSL